MTQSSRNIFNAVLFEVKQSNKGIYEESLNYEKLKRNLIT